MSRRGAVQRSPTFFVGAEKQKKDLDAFQRREQQLAEVYYKNKPLCFNACTYQRTHPVKANSGHRDADATLVSPMAVGVADGVSQIEEYGIDSSELPTELLRQCEELAFDQLLPRSRAIAPYHGPIPLVREAFCGTECLGSTTLVLADWISGEALLDNSTRIHGKLHPMIAVISIGDCELVILRRLQGRSGPLELVFHTEMQRVDGHCQTPLQLARVDERIDANFDDSITVEVIERGSAVHCISAYEGDIVIVGSDGVFDNLYLDEVAAIANTVLPPSGASRPTQSSLLTHLSKRIVEAAHQKTKPTVGGFLPEAPIGRGGKMDDTSCVVAEIIEWTEAHQKLYAREEVYPKWSNFWHCQVGCDGDENELQEYDGEMTPPGFRKKSRRDDEMFCSIS